MNRACLKWLNGTSKRLGVKGLFADAKPPLKTGKRIQRKRYAGWTMPPNTVYVERPTKWGNPFRVGIDGTLEECISQFEKMLRERTLVNNEYWLEPLRGKDLACWCPLDKPCHADVILKLLGTKA